MPEKKYPRIGIGVLIENEKKEVLLGLRKGSHGEGEWCFPGGHLNFRETIFQTAKREAKEETGLNLDNFELISISDDLRYIKSDGKHYVTVGVKARYKGGKVRLMEPEKCLKWQWFSLDNLPDKLLQGTELIIRNYRAGTIYQP